MAANPFYQTAATNEGDGGMVVNAANQQPIQLPDGRWQIYDPTYQPGLPVTWDPQYGYVVDGPTMAQYTGNMEQWFNTQQAGPDKWSTILPALMMAGVGGLAFSGAGAAGAADALGGAGGSLTTAAGGGGGAGAAASSEFLNSLYPSLGIEGWTGGGITGLGTGATTGAALTDVQQWAQKLGGLNSDGSINWANIDASIGEQGVTGLDGSTYVPDGSTSGSYIENLLRGAPSPGLGEGETEVPLEEVGGKSWLDSLLDPKNLVSAGLALGGAALTSNAAKSASGVQQQAAAKAAADQKEIAQATLAQQKTIADATLAQQKTLADQTTTQQRAIYDQIRADQEPFRQAGLGVLPRISAGVGVDGELTRKFTLADRDADPVYQSGLQFGLDRGTEGINQRAIGNRMYNSGATLKALTQFGNDYGTTKANESYNRFTNDQTNTYNKLAGVAGFGQTATNQVNAANTNFGNSQQTLNTNLGNSIQGVNTNLANSITGVNTNLGNSLSGLTTDTGNSRAASIVGGTNAWGGALSSIGNTINGSSSDKILRALLGNNYNSLGIV